MKVELELPRGRILFSCRACGRDLALSPPSFSITVTSIGETATPAWSCPCGVTGIVRGGLARVTGRISIPPSGAIAAGTDPVVRQAIVIERDAALDGAGTVGSVNTPYVQVQAEPAPCPQRGSHSAFSRSKLAACPICGKRFLHLRERTAR